MQSSKTVKFLFQSVSKILPYAIIITVAFPILFYNVLSLNSIPDYDYWNMISFSEEGISFDPYYLLWVRQNEHLAFLSKLTFAINVLVGHGDNLNLAILGWGTTVLSAMVLFRLLPPHLRQHYLVASFLAIFLSTFLFNPTMAEYWLQGQSIATCGPALLVFFTVFMSFYRFYLTQRWLWFSSAVGGMILANVSGSGGIPIWPALFFGAVIWKLDKRYLFILLIVGFTCYCYYFIGYSKPGNHPSLQFAPGVVANFYVILLGATFSSDLNTAKTLGILAIIASIWIVGITLRTDKSVRDPAIPWIMILLFELMSSGTAAIGRSGFGIEQAFSQRYALSTGVAWMSLGILTVIYFSHKPKNWCYLQIPVLLATLAMYQILIVGWQHPTYTMFRERERLKPLAAISLITGIYDNNLIAAAITGVTDQLLGKVVDLRKFGHVPFAGKLYKSCPTLGDKLSTHITTSSVLGYFDGLTVREDQVSAQVRGWAYSSQGEVTCVAIVNQNQTVQGLAVSGFERRDIATHLAVSNQLLGWMGYTHFSKGEKLSAYAKVGEQWYLLTGTLNP